MHIVLFLLIRGKNGGKSYAADTKQNLVRHKTKKAVRYLDKVNI
jgi:hypothetical protein